MNDYKLGIGVVSKNTVDAAITFANTYKIPLCFIPSRRQIEHNGGYVNNWTTETFAEYVKSRTTYIKIKRDHGGAGQGLTNDDGIASFNADCQYFDAIHVDPWKVSNEIIDGVRLTAQAIQHCSRNNKNITFEIGTEQSIFLYGPSELDYIINSLGDYLTYNQFLNIKYAVIQSGTALKGTENVGSYNPEILKQFLVVCKKHNLRSKEHNGDYISESVIHSKFELGLESINIAPEFGKLETSIYLVELDKLGLFDKFYDICFRSDRWKKWVDPSFDPLKQKRELVNICGHYVFSNIEFLRLKDSMTMTMDIDAEVQKQIFNKLYAIHRFS